MKKKPNILNQIRYQIKKAYAEWEEAQMCAEHQESKLQDLRDLYRKERQKIIKKANR